MRLQNIDYEKPGPHKIRRYSGPVAWNSISSFPLKLTKALLFLSDTQKEGKCLDSLKFKQNSILAVVLHIERSADAWD